MDKKRQECLPGHDLASWVLGCLGTWVLLSGIWVFGCLGSCEAAEQASLIPEAEIAALDRNLEQVMRGTSAVDVRMTCKSVVRQASALLDASPGAPNRFRVLGILFQAQKRLLGLEMSEKNRKALFDTCAKLSKAPDEYVELRLDADLLLSERDLAEADANVTERVNALKEIIKKYRDTPAEPRSLVIASLIATKLQAFDLAADIHKELARSSLGGNHEVIAFRRKSFAANYVDAVFSGTYESDNEASVTFPSDRLGHQYLVLKQAIFGGPVGPERARARGADRMPRPVAA